MCPAKKDFVRKNGIKKQKRLLPVLVKELKWKFISETGINLPDSILRVLREKSFRVVSPKLKDRESGLCMNHKKDELKVKK